MKIKVDKIYWKLTNRKEPQTCAVLAWEDFTAIEQQGYEKGWEARRVYEEKRRVGAARWASRRR